MAGFGCNLAEMAIFVDRENQVDQPRTFQEPGQMRELAHRIGADRLGCFDMPKRYGNFGTGNAGFERRAARTARVRPAPLAWTSFGSHSNDLPFRFVRGWACSRCAACGILCRNRYPLRPS